MIALSLETAKTIAVVVVIAFLAFMVMAALAIGVWTQRSSLQDCASKAKEQATAADRTGVTCTFFGTDVEVGT
jgi:hypothetical protein